MSALSALLDNSPTITYSTNHMQVVLYLMLALNLMMGYIGYMNGDQTQVRHAATFALVSVVGLLAAWGSRRVG